MFRPHTNSSWLGALLIACAAPVLASPPPEIGPIDSPTTLAPPPAEPSDVDDTSADAATDRAGGRSLATDEPTVDPLRAWATGSVRARAAAAERAPTVPFYAPPSADERALLYVAIERCELAARRFAKPFVMLELLRLEADLGIPEELRGVTLAAWCGEAAYRTDDIVGDGGRAVGILQLHPYLASLCGDPDLRHDPMASARCWLTHIVRVQDKAERRCGVKRSWKAAELWVSQGGQKSGYSCEMVSGHVARLERWQRVLRLSADRVAMSDPRR